VALLFGCVVPHPPVLLPEVGQEMAREVEPTVEALQELGKNIASYEPQTLVLISPHGPLFRDSMAIGLAPEARGDFANFQAPKVKLQVACDTELAAAIQQACARVALPVTAVDNLSSPESGGVFYWLDHGAAVPLHFLLPLMPAGVKVVLLGYSWQPRATHQAFGERIRQACEESGKRVVFVASGDLSHRLIPAAPAGYDPLGRVFDEEVVAGLAAGDWQRIRGLSVDLVERAGVCGYHSILTLAGAVGEEVNSRVLCYQGPFGVGYVVAEVKPKSKTAGGPRQDVEHATPRPETESAAPAMEAGFRGSSSGATTQAVNDPVLSPQDPVPSFAFPASAGLGGQILALARASLETYVRIGRQLRLPLDLPPPLRSQQACFVTIRSNGQLRGCVGTIAPARANLAHEIVENAIGSAARDYRFLPVQAHELPGLRYSVDVLSPLQAVASQADFDPAIHGMVVMQGPRVGVLLPGIPEVTNAARQFEVCCDKAGIVSPDGIQLYRFGVTRYAEPGAEH
jgi:AmmeMemoRadiSam system protein A/AmmeMemoRadiSam system protein B